MAHRIILIDPIPGSLEELAGNVAGAGHIIVDKCASYENGIESVSAYRPNVVILTLMPDRLPGLQLLQNIRSLYPKLALIVVSFVRPDPATVRFCKEQNVTDFLIRPFSYDRIISALSSIKEQEESHQRGVVVCVGFTPVPIVKLMISQLQLGYLFYPSCHLAIQCFRQNRRNRFVCLIVQKDLDMYSNMLRQREKIRGETELSPWKQVVFEAQLAYQDYWKDSIQAGFLPQLIPCLYLPRRAKFPWVLPAEVMESLQVELVSSEKDFKQIVPSKTAVEGTMGIYQDVARQVDSRLDVVEREQPHLIYSREEMTVRKEIEIPKRIETVKEITPTPRDKDNRMTISDKD